MSVCFVLLFFSLGVVVASYLPILPPLYTLFLLLTGVFLRKGPTAFVYFWMFLLGVGWGVYTGHRLLSSQLDSSLETKVINVSGWVEGIPQVDAQKTRFLLRVIKAEFPEQQSLLDRFPQKLQLSWYQRGRDSVPEIIPGTHWTLQVRLKKPRGFANPGGFDYQVWLLRQAIGATGYVISGTTDEVSSHLNGFALIDRWRWQLQQWVLSHSRGGECGILMALLIGDTSHVDKAHWLLMQQTGTSHLIAISGLHVGFLAIVGYWVGMLVGRFLQLIKGTFANNSTIYRIGPAQRWGYICAIGFAAFYSALAGFNIPTVRTLIMIVVFYLSALGYRPVRLSHSYFLALSLVLIVDPLAAYDLGFWLSFGAVAVLLVSFSGRYGSGVGKSTAKTILTRDRRVVIDSALGKMVGSYIQSQRVMLIGSLVPLGILMNSTPLLAPIANFLAIPLVTFFVVPCLLLGALFSPFDRGSLLLGFAEHGLNLLSIWLKWLFSWGSGSWDPVLMPLLVFSPFAIALLSLASLVLLLPRGFFPKWIGLLGLIAGLVLGLWRQENPPGLAVTVMDVGQGTAVVVTTQKHVLVYDTGPRYSEDFDAGAGILLPYLHSQGISHLDTIVVSHGDLDHAGGLEGLIQGIGFSTLLEGEPNTKMAQSCHEQKPWQWDGVKFRFLHWPIRPGASANNHSCVLLVEYGAERVLLPGDIESSAEWALLRGDELPGHVTLLLAAHHGSRTSSNPAFVAYSQPTWVVYSAGYLNQHGHPHPQVQQRFEQQGSRSLNTALQGALSFSWRPGKAVEVRAERQEHKRYWYELPPVGYVLP